jgi:hypothetical protein
MKRKTQIGNGYDVLIKIMVVLMLLDASHLRYEGASLKLLAPLGGMHP